MDENELHDDPTMILRRFAAEITPGDGRTADVRIVPWGARAVCRDGHGGVPLGVPYTEEWAPGAFDHQINAANRLTANLEHEEGVSGIVARGVSLRSSPDGQYGSFTFLNTPNGDTALELVKEGVFDGISLEAYPHTSKRMADGVVQRIKGHLRAIAFCRVPAYAGAGVLALREDGTPVEHQMIVDEELLVPAVDPETLKRMAALGIKLPVDLAAQAKALEEPTEE